MKTNLLAQNDNLVIENLKADVGKSVMDLSHSTTFPVDVDGAIYPICCVETVPSDSFEINVECLLRQLSPLKVPLMTNLRLNTAYYYCDNRLAWKKWDRFMTGGRSGNELYDIPRLANYQISASEQPTKYTLFDESKDNASIVEPFQNIKFKNSLHTYFGISLNLSVSSNPNYSNTKDYSDELPVAFPFFDYQMICRDYYTNVDRLAQNPSNWNQYTNFDNPFSDWTYNNLFPSDDDEIRLIDGPQVHSGYYNGDDPNVNEGVGFILDKIRYHDVRPDYFTTSKKAPMRGDAPTLPGEASTVTLPNGSTLNLKNVDIQNTQANWPKNAFTVTTNDYDDTEITSNWLYNESNTQNIKSQYNLTAEGDRSVVADLSKANIIKSKTDNDLTFSASITNNITAADIRLLSQLTVWQELNMLHEPYYNDFLNAHFDGVRVGESPVEKPQYIGGTSQLISINEILQTSQTTTGDTGSPLGNQGATAMSLANNFVGRYYCNNYGYIIGIAYIVPEMMYKPAMPRGFSRRTKEDYYSPEFANLSMQATLNKEIFFSNDDDWNNAPWGYTGAYDELRSIPNRIAGDLLNPDYIDLQKWVLTREMANDNKPAMETTWLSLKDNVDKTAWSVQTMPAFMLQCANYIKAVRPMPKVAIPKAL